LLVVPSCLVFECRLHSATANRLVEGGVIECPKHNGRFDYKTGEVKRRPACVDIRTHPVRVEDGKVLLRLPE